MHNTTNPVGEPIETLSTYRLIRLIGLGAFGQVYEAYQSFLERRVAIKILHADLESDPKIEQLFMREARTIARLRHPNMVTVYEFGTGTQNSRPITYMVMEYLVGDTLRDRLKLGPLTLTEIVSIFEQLASGLDYAHTQGVVHRDLKPANIMFSERHQPVIVDFGLASLVKLQAGTSAGYILETGISGTPQYMAPEQVAAEPIGPATDQYALALIIFEMLSGRLPFSGDDAHALMQARLNEAPIPLRRFCPQFSTTAEQVLQRALSRQPQDRFSSVGEFTNQLGDALLPNRLHVGHITVSDPVQVAMLQATRQSLTIALWAVVAGTIIALLYCISVFVQGYSAGKSPFLWDGVVEPNVRLASGQRIINGLWPGSVAQQAGLQIGDLRQNDLTKDRTVQTADFMINGRPRSDYPIDWQPELNALIQYTAFRNGLPIVISYRLERSPYQLILLVMNLLPIALTLGVAIWLLWRWGAEPGVRMVTPMLLAASLTVMGVVILRLLPGINILAIYWLLPTAIHFVLIFPKPSRFAERYRRHLWLLYIPCLIGLIQFLLNYYVRLGNVDANVVLFGCYGVVIFVVAFFKWGQHDLRHYPGLKFIMLTLGILIFSTVGSTLIWGQDYQNSLNWFGNGVNQLLLGYAVIAIGASIGAVLLGIGYHQVQLQLGSSLIQLQNRVNPLPDEGTLLVD